MSNNTTFVKITNNDIYKKLECIENKLDKNKTQIKLIWLTLSGYAFMIIYILYSIK
ncbi:MAG: hypothetical protein AABY22_17070 [Nanoarchaeota archaeon]|mgnify:CR=1 FL=1